MAVPALLINQALVLRPCDECPGVAGPACECHAFSKAARASDHGLFNPDVPEGYYDRPWTPWR